MTSHGSHRTCHTAQMMTSHRSGTSWGERDRTGQPADYELDTVATMLRCVVAAESYRLTGALPEWVRDSGEACAEVASRAGTVGEPAQADAGP